MPGILSYLEQQASRQTAIVLEHMSGARAGIDPEDLHIVRVASRRLRETLRALEHLSPSRIIARYRLAVRRITHSAGRIRELDVAREYLRSRESSIPASIRRRLKRQIDPILCSGIRAERARLNRALDPKGFRRLAVTAAPAPENIPSDEFDTARKMVKRRLGQTRKLYHKIDGRKDARRLHRFRIAIKKLRYLLEIFEPFLKRRWAPTMRRTRKLQGLLGRLHDDYVTARIFRAAARTAGSGAREPVRFVCDALATDYKRQFRRLNDMRMPWED